MFRNGYYIVDSSDIYRLPTLHTGESLELDLSKPRGFYMVRVIQTAQLRHRSQHEYRESYIGDGWAQDYHEVYSYRATIIQSCDENTFKVAAMLHRGDKVFTDVQLPAVVFKRNGSLTTFRTATGHDIIHRHGFLTPDPIARSIGYYMINIDDMGEISVGDKISETVFMAHYAMYQKLVGLRIPDYDSETHNLEARERIEAAGKRKQKPVQPKPQPQPQPEIKDNAETKPMSKPTETTTDPNPFGDLKDAFTEGAKDGTAAGFAQIAGKSLARHAGRSLGIPSTFFEGPLAAALLGVLAPLFIIALGWLWADMPRRAWLLEQSNRALRGAATQHSAKLIEFAGGWLVELFSAVDGEPPKGKDKGKPASDDIDDTGPHDSPN